MRAPVRAFYSHLCEIVQPCLKGSSEDSAHEAHISLTRQDGNISMKLKSELAGLPFYWEFRCIPASVPQVQSTFSCKPFDGFTGLKWQKMDGWTDMAPSQIKTVIRPLSLFTGVCAAGAPPVGDEPFTAASGRAAKRSPA